jgi:hypothetical protein
METVNWDILSDTNVKIRVPSSLSKGMSKGPFLQGKAQSMETGTSPVFDSLQLPNEQTTDLFMRVIKINLFREYERLYIQRFNHQPKSET